MEHIDKVLKHYNKNNKIPSYLQKDLGGYHKAQDIENGFEDEEEESCLTFITKKYIKV